MNIDADAWVTEAIALCDAGHADAAEAMLAVAISRGIQSGQLLFEHAMSAYRRGDQLTAATRFALAARMFPTHVDSWVLALRTLRGLGQYEQAAVLGAEGLVAIPHSVGLLVEAAAVAELRRDLSTVRELCGIARRLDPESPDAWITEVRALRTADELDAAAELLVAAGRLTLVHPALLTEAAVIAESRGDVVELERIAARLREEYPSSIEGYAITLRSQMAAGDLAAAEAFFSALPPSVLADPGLTRTGCELALRLGEHELALKRCTDAVTRLPENGELHGMMLIAMVNAGQKDFVESYAEAHIDRFPEEPRIAMEYAKIAESRGDRETALRRWEYVRTQFPHIPDGYTYSSSQLLALGRYEEADAVTAAGYSRFPDDPFVLRQYAMVATRRRDWQEAGRRWELARERYPDMPEIALGIGDMKMRMADERTDADESQRAPPAPSRPAAGGLEQLALSFEGLGSNCEFGIVQRMAGAEPLGLLRWANIGPEQLAKMLGEHCAGVGAPETTRLAVNGSGEYELSDPRYFGMHTFIHVGQIPEDRLQVISQHRLRKLSEKLMEDLEIGEKIFVYRQHHAPIEDWEMHLMFDAIRAYGPGRLLCVHKPTDPAGDGTVECPRPGLFLANMAVLDDNPIISRERFEIWIALLQKIKASAD